MKYSDLYYSLTHKYERDFSALADFEKKCPEGAFVDVGAGFGRLLDLPSARPKLLLESSPDMIARLQVRILDSSHHKIIAGNAMSMPLSDSSVMGLTYANNAMCEMKPTFFALAEASRVLQYRGGIFISAQDPNWKPAASSGPFIRNVDGADCTLRIDCFSTPLFAPYGFFTHISANERELDYQFYISQTFPSLDFWKIMLSGFQFDSVEILDEQTNRPITEETSQVGIVAFKGAGKPEIFQQSLCDLYDSLAPSYSDILQKAQYAVPDWLNSLCQPFANLHVEVLDLGCGTGIVGEILSVNNCIAKVYGIDFSEQMLSICRTKQHYAGLAKADLSLGVPLAESACFDIISACGVLEFLPNISLVLSDIRRMLRIGGEAWLCFELSAPQSGPHGLFDPSARGIRWHYTSEQIANLLAEAKLHVCSQKEVIGYRRILAGHEVPYLLVQAKRTEL